MQIIHFSPLWLTPIYITTTDITGLVILCNSLGVICLHNIVFLVFIDFLSNHAALCTVHNSITQMQTVKVLIFTEPMACLYKIWNEMSGSSLLLQMKALLSAEWVFRDESWWQRADVVSQWYKLCSLWSEFRDVFSRSCPSVAISHWHLLHQKVWTGQHAPALLLEQISTTALVSQWIYFSK